MFLYYFIGEDGRLQKIFRGSGDFMDDKNLRESESSVDIFQFIFLVRIKLILEVLINIWRENIVYFY